jgi:ubiquinone/menaquinone biosynthesis C-methylase UbiE
MVNISPSRRVSFWSFGYVPTGRSRDVLRRLLGFPNLLKRAQARAVMRALDVRPDDTCLDVGCGSGYFTIEMAKLGNKAIGVDTNTYVTSIRIPPFLEGKLSYLSQDARSLPIPDASIDVVLCSEVLMMIAQPEEFLNEVARVLKPGGRLVAVNGLGHPAIREGYKTKGMMFQLSRLMLWKHMPASYEDYYKDLQAHFKTALQPEDPTYYPQLLERMGFRVQTVSYSPSALAGSFLSWLQFNQFNSTGEGVTKFRLFNFLMATILNGLDKVGYQGGQILVATPASQKG